MRRKTLLSTKHKTLISTICLFITAIIWGLAFVAQRSGIDYMGSFTYNAVRFALGAVSLLPLIFILERKSGFLKTAGYGLICGVILFIASSLQQLGVEYTGSAGKAGFITGLYTVIVPIVGIFLGRKTSVLTWIAAVLALSGLYLLSVPKGLGSIGIGDVLLFCGAFFWAAHILLLDRFSAKLNPLQFSSVQFGVCAAISFVFALILESGKSGRLDMSGILAGWLPLLYGGLLSVGVAYTLQVVGQRHVEPAKASIIFSLESLFAALGAALILHERMSLNGYIGSALIFCGIILSQIPARKKEATASNG
ncbi:MAG: DMT family transporter [Oscillospiraceae bacterium]|jgi:drug/metabolite transporter (DMT)-like permease|nr:DMT family transporter [Oscillospiraceae bacterium]